MCASTEFAANEMSLSSPSQQNFSLSGQKWVQRLVSCLGGVGAFYFLEWCRHMATASVVKACFFWFSLLISLVVFASSSI